MADQDTKRAECPDCGKTVQVLPNGSYRAHRKAGDRCPMSGQSHTDYERSVAATTRPAEPSLTPEVVDDPQPQPESAPGTAVERHQPDTAPALAAATEAALAMPGVPGMDEFLSLAMQARMLSMSGAAPAHVRNHPHIAFHVAMIGRDLGISPTAAIQLIDVIGKEDDPNPQLSLSPELLNGQIRRLGLGAIRPIRRSMWECVAGAYGPDGTLLGESEFTWVDAVVAGLADDRCEPNKHWVPSGGQGRCRCRQGYRTYPQRMLWWRASGFAAQDYFPEAGLGLYSPEALGAIVDEQGRPIDPTEVELPEGYRPGHGNGPARGAPTEAMADGGDLWVLQSRIFALPDEQKEAWRQQRSQNPRFREGGRPIPAHQLPENAYRVAKSMLQGLETAASREGYERDEAPHALRMQFLWLFYAAIRHAFGHMLVTEPVLTPEIVSDGPPPPQDPEPDREPSAATQAAETGRQPDPGLRAAIEAEVTGLSVEDVEAELRGTHGIDPAGLNAPMMRQRLVMAELDTRGGSA